MLDGGPAETYSWQLLFLSDADLILCSSCFSTSYLEVGPSHVIPDDQSFASSDNVL